MRDLNWPGLFLLTSHTSSISISLLAGAKKVLESFDQAVGRMSLHLAVDGESRPFIDPQTKTKEADPKRPLWTTFIASTVVRMQKGGQDLA